MHKIRTEGAKDHNSRMTMQRVFSASLRTILGALPPDAPMFIYTKLLRLKPLRALTNTLLRKLIPKEITIPEGTLYLNQRDPVVSGALTLGAYEPYFAEEFRKHLKPGSIVVDIGANLGYYTLIASALAQRVIAYEPEKENLDLLRRTIEKNNLQNVIVIEKGIGAKDEELALTLDPDNKGKHTLLSNTEGEKKTISVTTLDSSIALQNIKHIDLIKMDIEGWEGYAFKGMVNVLQNMSPIIFFEFAPRRIEESGESPIVMLHTLERFGYKLFVIDESKKALVQISDVTDFSSSFEGKDSYVNVIAKK